MKNQRTDAFLFETTTQDHHQQKKKSCTKTFKENKWFILYMSYDTGLLIFLQYSEFFFFVASYNKCIENTLHELSLTHFPNNSWFSR